jgi:cytochrome c-type biogenesis protein CcmH/NrfF
VHEQAAGRLRTGDLRGHEAHHPRAARRRRLENRYGPKVRADLPKSGFNLLLFGWVGAALVGVAGAGALYLASLRRRASRRAAAGPPADEAWLDEVLGRAEDGA